MDPEDLKDVSLTSLLQRIIAFGLSEKRPALAKRTKQTSWQLGFDLRPWSEWKPEHHIIKNEFFSQRTIQEVVVRVVFKCWTDLGYSSMPVMAVTFNRQMPVGEWREPPHHEKEFEGCEWVPVFIRYCPSPSRTSEIIALELD